MAPKPRIVSTKGIQPTISQLECGMANKNSPTGRGWMGFGDPRAVVSRAFLGALRKRMWQPAFNDVKDGEMIMDLGLGMAFHYRGLDPQYKSRIIGLEKGDGSALSYATKTQLAHGVQVRPGNWLDLNRALHGPEKVTAIVGTDVTNLMSPDEFEEVMRQIGGNSMIQSVRFANLMSPGKKWLAKRGRVTERAVGAGILKNQRAIATIMRKYGFKPRQFDEVHIATVSPRELLPEEKVALIESGSLEKIISPSVESSRLFALMPGYTRAVLYTSRPDGKRIPPGKIAQMVRIYGVSGKRTG